MSRLPCTTVSALLQFLLERAEEDTIEARSGDQVDHVLLDGSQVVQTLVARVAEAADRGERHPQLRSLQVRALLYADHHDYREEWRPRDGGTPVELLLMRKRPHLRRRRWGTGVNDGT